MFKAYKALSKAGILGINERNARYVSQMNPRRLFPLVDDKVRTKQLAVAADMAVPELYGVISSQSDIQSFDQIVEERDSFVIKPARGSGGDGIVVIAGKRKGRFRTVSGRLISSAALRHHISNTVGGQYSLSGNPDSAVIEYCVQFDPLFEQVSYQGVPDIRLIVYRGYPVMGMVRLPTQMSDGKANLHQGAVGVGIDLASGVTVGGVLGNQPTEEHPDTFAPIAGIPIGHWDSIMMSAARCYDVTGLGYLGVDIVIDRHLGPLMLELNARPGLNIQIANGAGLKPRLRKIDQAADPNEDALMRAERSKTWFAVEHAPLKQAVATS